MKKQNVFRGLMWIALIMMAADCDINSFKAWAIWELCWYGVFLFNLSMLENERFALKMHRLYYRFMHNLVCFLIRVVRAYKAFQENPERSVLKTGGNY